MCVCVSVCQGMLWYFNTVQKSVIPSFLNVVVMNGPCSVLQVYLFLMRVLLFMVPLYSDLQ